LRGIPYLKGLKEVVTEGLKEVVTGALVEAA
jgi:hypothetical protein